MSVAASGKDSVEALTQILEYFDSSSKSLKVDSISGEKLDFVLRALGAASGRIDDVLAAMPAELVLKTRAFIEEENDLNLREYNEANPGTAYLNPAPKV